MDGSTPGLPTMTPYSLNSCGAALSISASWSTVASAVFPAANRAYFIPFVLHEATTIKQLFAYNGAAVSGNIDMGIYDEFGTRLVSAGSTAQAGTSTLQVFDIADTTIGPGRFYLAVALDNTTGTFTRISLSVVFIRNAGVVQMASAFPLPATAAFANVVNSYIPVAGYTTKAVI